MQPKKAKIMTSVTIMQLSVNVIFWMNSFGTAHGNTVSPPWITLRGCFEYISNNETSNIQKNEPTQCFEKCQGFQSVGLKNMLCICNPSYTTSSIMVNRLCDLMCPGKSKVYCGREDAGHDLMSVYTRDTPLPDGITGSTSYGYGYVVVSGSITYHASDNNTSMQYGYLCYNDFASNSMCLYDKATSWTWEGAVNECNGRGARIMTASDIGKCTTGGAFVGTYWIGIYRDKPDVFTTTTISTITKITTIQTTTTIRTIEMTNLTVASTEMKKETTNWPTFDYKTATAHENTVWRPWITLSGCFKYSSNTATINIQKNEPTKCFELCQGNQSVGLKNMSCTCNPMYTSSGMRSNRLCNLPCPGKSEVYCGREGAGNELMSVYTRDTPLPGGINGSTSYGNGYVVISGGNIIFHSSDNNTSLQHGYLCYDDFVSPGSHQCIQDKSTSWTWVGAINACNSRSARLITASDVSQCPVGSAFDGTYWIGIYRENPDSTTSTATTATSKSSTSPKRNNQV